LDGWQIAVFRPVQSDSRDRRAAREMRRTLFDKLREVELQHGWVPYSLRDSQKQKLLDGWSNGQGLTAMLKTPEARTEELNDCLKSLEASFAPEFLVEKDGKKYGWVKEFGSSYQYTLAPPALWTAACLGAALGRPGLLKGSRREQFEEHLKYTQEVLRSYRPLETGGWNLFPNQTDPSEHDPYVTSLALLALLEVRAAGASWDGSNETRDTLLHNTASWLVNHFTNTVDEIGWWGAGESVGDIKDGLTLQIFAELLRAESEAGFLLPSNILRRIPDHLIECTSRNMRFKQDMSEASVSFTNHLGQPTSQNETIEFPWHPWAINCAVRWLERAKNHPVPPDQVFRVKRALGHLLVDLKEEAMARALSGWTYEASETLYGLGVVPPPD
jgi:hypothetical protein